MIGPAEIEGMMLEREEALAKVAAAAHAPLWPSFVDAEHLDEADRVLIGSFDAWVASHLSHRH